MRLLWLLPAVSRGSDRRPGEPWPRTRHIRFTESVAIFSEDRQRIGQMREAVIESPEYLIADSELEHGVRLPYPGR
jgi:hypothetical protein